MDIKKTKRTKIVDLNRATEEVGEMLDLSDNDLALKIYGGRMSASAGSCTEPGACDDE